MNKNVKKFTRQMRKEAERQLRGFPREFKYQLGSGWGEEFANQIFGIPKHRRRRGY